MNKKNHLHKNSDGLQQFEKYILSLILVAIGIKLFLFLYIAFVTPSSIIEADSTGYLSDANSWVHYFVVPSEGLMHSLYRTPGYSLFLAVFHLGLNLPLLSIVLLQFILNGLTAYIILKTFTLEDRLTGLLSVSIIMLDIPLTVYSSMILTESFFVFVFSIFLYLFIKYVNNRKFLTLLGAAFVLGFSVYIRPVGLYLEVPIAVFIIYLWLGKKIFIGLTHAFVFLVIVYGLLVTWQYHNLVTHHEFTFSTIDRATICENGIIGRYARERDPKLKAMPPALYYVETIGRNFLSLMTTPGNMKYYHSHGLFLFSAVFGYLLVVFWWIGLIICIWRYRSEKIAQFLFLVILYFIAVSLESTGWLVTPRFRVPMLPAIAILSARGWVFLLRICQS